MAEEERNHEEDENQIRTIFSEILQKGSLHFGLLF